MLKLMIWSQTVKTQTRCGTMRHGSSCATVMEYWYQVDLALEELKERFWLLNGLVPQRSLT